MRAPSALVGCVVSRGNLQAGGFEPGLTHDAGTLGPWDPARVARLIKRLRQFLDGSARVGLRHLMDLSGLRDWGACCCQSCLLLRVRRSARELRDAKNNNWEEHRCCSTEIMTQVCFLVFLISSCAARSRRLSLDCTTCASALRYPIHRQS